MLRAAPIRRKSSNTFSHLFRAAHAFQSSTAPVGSLRRMVLLEETEDVYVFLAAVGHEVLTFELPRGFEPERPDGLDPLVPVPFAISNPRRVAIVASRVVALAALSPFFAVASEDGTVALFHLTGQTAELVRLTRAPGPCAARLALIDTADLNLAGADATEPSLLHADLARHSVQLLHVGAVVARWASPLPIFDMIALSATEYALATGADQLLRLAWAPVAAPPGGWRTATPRALQLMAQIPMPSTPRTLAATDGTIHAACADRAIVSVSAAGRVLGAWRRATKYEIEAVLPLAGVASSATLAAVGRAGDVLAANALAGTAGNRHDHGFRGDAAWAAAAAVPSADLLVGITSSGSLFVLTRASALAITPAALGQEGHARAVEEE